MITFIGNLFWFWIALGVPASLLFWGVRLSKAGNRAKFNDEAIRDWMSRGAYDPMHVRLVEIFGSRLGAVVLVFLFWPLALHSLVTPGRKS